MVAWISFTTESILGEVFLREVGIALHVLQLQDAHLVHRVPGLLDAHQRLLPQRPHLIRRPARAWRSSR
jgi:hypothetical protein